MEPSFTKRPHERAETDAMLLAEREKTDAALARKSAIEQDADRVVEVARDRAGATLQAARDLADQQTPPLEPRTEVQIARAKEDATVTAENAAADEQLRLEREERERALWALLRLEREGTDSVLLVERARADEVVATRDVFLGMVSHDLRSMLSGIAINASVLARQGASTEGDPRAVMTKAAGRIQRLTDRMNALVGDLLDIVSLEAGKFHVNPVAHDAVQLVRDAVDAFQGRFSDKGLTLTADLAEAPIAAVFDNERILQVIGNLLSNALKFTPRGGVVALLVAGSESEVHFSVTDSGVGIPAGKLTAVFEQFRQLDAGSRPGLGLGLYIAKAIVDAHGGRIWADNETQGTTFHFALPCGTSAAA